MPQQLHNPILLCIMIKHWPKGQLLDAPGHISKFVTFVSWTLCKCDMYANRLPLYTCFCSSPLPPLTTIGISEQKQMTLAKYCNSLSTELGPIYTSSHRICLLIELQKFCCLFDPRGLVFFILRVVLSATLEVIIIFFSFYVLSPFHCSSKLNCPLTLQAFPWWFNPLCQPYGPLFLLDCSFLTSASLSRLWPRHLKCSFLKK